MVIDSVVESSFPTAIHTGVRIRALLTARGRDRGHLDSLKQRFPGPTDF